MATDPGDHFYKDVREQQRGFRKVTGRVGGMRLATIMLLAIVAIGSLGLVFYLANDRTITVSDTPPVTTGQGDRATIPAPRDSETPRN
jgi:hypothetical protein